MMLNVADDDDDADLVIDWMSWPSVPNSNELAYSKSRRQFTSVSWTKVGDCSGSMQIVHKYMSDFWR